MQDDQNNQNQQNQTDQQSGDPLVPVDEEGQQKSDPTQSPAVTGEEDASGSAPNPTSDDDTGKMVEEVTGEEPKQGETMADIVNRAEEERTRPPEPAEEKNSPTSL